MTEPRTDSGTESEEPPERIDRRRLLSRGLVFGAGLVAGAAATGVGVAIWRSDDEENKIVTVGSLPEVQRRIEKTKEPIYLDGPNVFVASFPLAALESARHVYPDRVLAGMQFGLVALLARCTHLGCRLPYCPSSGWFECPCHGAKFDAVGERRGGPAPRGLDHHPLRVDGDLTVTVNTGVLLSGAPFGTDTTESSPNGLPCV